MDGKNEERIKDILNDSMDNRTQILEFSQVKNMTELQTIRLEILVQKESKSILKEKGQTFTVYSGKKDRRSMKMRYCWGNSSKMMLKGYGYVEGYVIHKENGIKYSHSWNVDSNGVHWDFTYDNPEDYEYFGIIIPDNIVWEVGRKNGGMWYCVLPFIDDFSSLQ